MNIPQNFQSIFFHFFVKIYSLSFQQVWKVKKAFKIQIFWKGGKPTFLVGVNVTPAPLPHKCLIFRKTIYVSIDLTILLNQNSQADKLVG